MRIKAFSAGKPKTDPDTNEDLFVILPRLGFAVIDGLSDRTGHRYDGLSAGQMAARLVAADVASWLTTDREAPPATLVTRLTARIAQAYTEHGIAEVALAQPGRRFGATLSLAIELGNCWRFVLIGDSGIRLNGAELLQNDHPVDVITAAMRGLAYRLAQSRGADLNAAAQVGRSAAFNGIAALASDMEPWLTLTDLDAIRAATVQETANQLSHVTASDIAILLDHGIIHGQGRFQNNTKSPMSYAVLDGTAVPIEHVSIIDRAKSTIQTIELFTDGYMCPPQGKTIHDWEASFMEVEREDPAKVGAFPCPKGSTEERWFDDRTVVIVELDCAIQSGL